MSLYRHLLRSLRSASSSSLSSSSKNPSILSTIRPFAFSSAEEAAAERRRRKRRLRIEPPLHALRRDPSAPRPPPDPNAPRLPDSTSALVGTRLSLHNQVQSLIRSGNLDPASDTARRAVFSRIRPTVFTCNAVMAAMLRAKRLDNVVDLFSYFYRQADIVPNVVSYNILINSHCDAGRVDVALDVYRHILENAPFSPSPVTYRHLTKGLVDADRIQEAMDLLREMLNRGHGADSLVYKILMQGFIDRGNMEKAYELFDELKERCMVYDGVVHTTFMEAYWKQGKDKEAMENYQSLLDRQFNMSPATCNVLLDTLLKHDKDKEADQLFQSMLDRHNHPAFQGLNTETYNIMVNRKLDLGKFDEAIEVFTPASIACSPASIACSPPSGKRSRDPDDEVYLDNFQCQKRYLSEVMASSLNGLTFGDSLVENLMESPARTENICYTRDEFSPQCSPMSEDSDESRYYHTPLNTSTLPSDAMSCCPTSPVSPNHHQSLSPARAPTSSPHLAPPSSSHANAACSHPRHRSSDSDGIIRFPPSPNDVCHNGDLRRTALLRSVQLRAHPHSPVAYELPFGRGRDGEDMPYLIPEREAADYIGHCSATADEKLPVAGAQ